jgi:hypothetical protein
MAIMFDEIDLKYMASAIEYSYAGSIGQLRLDDENYIDKEGAIKIFQDIDEHVGTIAVYVDDKFDVLYSNVQGEWMTFIPKQ